MKEMNLSKQKISIVNIFILEVLLMVYVLLIVTFTQNTINLLPCQSQS